MTESTRPRVERPPKLGPIPVTEKRMREIENIPEPPKTGERNSLRGRIGATPDFSPEMQKTLLAILDEADISEDRAWKALEILNRRTWPAGEGGEGEIDLTFTEFDRDKVSQTRVVETDDKEFRVTVIDIITNQIQLRNRLGQVMTLIFTEQLP